MEIGFIGAGRAGSALALALGVAGHRITGVADLDPGRAASLAGELPGAAAKSPADVAAAAEVVVMSVPDGAIAAAAAELAPRLAGLRGRTFLHLSGAHPAALLDPLRAAGAIGSLHPLLSLAEPRSGAAGLRGCFYAIEGEPAAEAVAESLVESLGGRIIHLRARDKTVYHAAAVMVSNYLVGLVDAALGLYERLGLDRADAREAIGPLLTATAANIRRLGTEDALTGPISRGDLATVAEHLDALRRLDPLLGEVYRVMGRATTALAARAGRIDETRARDLQSVFGGGWGAWRRTSVARWKPFAAKRGRAKGSR